MKRNCSLLLLLALLLTLLVVPVSAEAQLSHVTDAAGILTYDEWEVLEVRAARLSQQYGCGVYMITVEDYRELGAGDVFQTTYEIYHGYELGEGADRDGLVLLLSMAERDFALFVYGDKAEYAFDSYGQQMLEEQFLPPFGEDDWYGGFSAYVGTCEEYLALAEAGEPVRESPAGLIALFIAISFIISLIVVLILRSGMKNVVKQSQAYGYVTDRLNLTGRHDQYTHTTETRRKIQSSSGSGSSHARVGGGGSGRSGKF